MKIQHPNKNFNCALHSPTDISLVFVHLEQIDLLDLIPEFTGTVLVEKLDLVDKTTTPARKCLDSWRFFC